MRQLENAQLSHQTEKTQMAGKGGKGGQEEGISTNPPGPSKGYLTGFLPSRGFLTPLGRMSKQQPTITAQPQEVLPSFAASE